MGPKTDYHALASKLRSAYVARAQRVEQTREAQAEQGHLALDDVLRHLDTPAAAPMVQALTDKANELLLEHRARREATPDAGPFDVLGDHWLPEEPFERALTRAALGMDPCTPALDAADLPRVLTEAFARTTDHGGMIDPGVVRRDLGPTGARILEAIAQGLASFRPGTERPKLKYEGLSHGTRQKVAFSAGRHTFVDRMPAFTELVEHLAAEQRPFAGFTMASVQHLFPSTMALYDALIEGGLERPATGVGGKNYSANPDVTARMAAEGWDVAWQAHPTPQAAGLDAEATVYAMARQQLSQLFRGCKPHRESKPRFLLLDDGGKLLRALHDFFPQYAHLCVGVEQTDRGIQVIEQMRAEGVQLDLPVVDMARSAVKKTFEAPMIGEAIVTNSLAALEAASPGFRPERETATIIGFGAIGRATAQALLRRGYAVGVVEPDPHARAEAERLGCSVGERSEVLGQGQLLISCTGRTTMSPEEFSLLPNRCVLVNGASGNHELGLHDVPSDYFARADARARTEGGRRVTEFAGDRLDLGDALGDEAMRHRVIRNGEHEVMVLRSGYVINMTDGLPPEYVQLVLGLLYASCHQAAALVGHDERPKGLVPLDVGAAEWLEQRTESALNALGLDLHAPDFSGLASWRL